MTNKMIPKRLRTVLLSSTVALCLVTGGPVAHAIGGDTAMLSNIYGELTAQLEKMKEELEAVKATNDAIYDAREHLNTIRHEYEFVRDFRPEQELNNLVGWADNQTNLNELDGQSWQRKWSLLSQEIDQRFERSGSVQEEAKEGAKGDLKEKVRYQALKEFYRKKAMETEADSVKDLQRKTASSTSMMASLMLQRREEKLQEKIEKRKAAMEAMEWDREFVDYLRGDRQ